MPKKYPLTFRQMLTLNQFRLQQQMRQQQTKRRDNVNEHRDRHAVHPQRLHRAIVAVVLENGRIRGARALPSAQLYAVIRQVADLEQRRGEEQRQEQERERTENQLHVELRHWQAVLPCQQRAACGDCSIYVIDKRQTAALVSLTDILLQSQNNQISLEERHENAIPHRP